MRSAMGTTIPSKADAPTPQAATTAMSFASVRGRYSASAAIGTTRRRCPYSTSVASARELDRGSSRRNSLNSRSSAVVAVITSSCNPLGEAGLSTMEICDLPGSQLLRDCSVLPESGRQSRVIGFAPAIAQDLFCLRSRHPWPIWTIRRECVIAINDREYSRAKGYVLALQSSGIARTVPSLVVMPDNRFNRVWEVD